MWGTLPQGMGWASTQPKDGRHPPKSVDTSPPSEARMVKGEVIGFEEEIERVEAAKGGKARPRKLEPASQSEEELLRPRDGKVGKVKKA